MFWLFWEKALIILFGLGLVILFWLYLSGAFQASRRYNLIGLAPSEPQFPATIASLSDSLITSGQVVQFWSDIEAIQTARLALMAQARELIQFETFKMTPGKRTEAFADVLCERAIAGVRVQVLADSYGAKDLPSAYWHRLRRSGVQVRFFNPFTVRSPLNYIRRNHRKLLIVDQTRAMFGGAGISDLWDGNDGKSEQPWYDFEMQWRGEVVGLLTGFFWQHWLTAGGHVNLTDHQPLSPTKDTQSSPVLITPGEEPTTGDSPIRSLFQLCIASAQKRLWMASPYLLPDRVTGAMLAAACQRGVDVRILTMGPKSDKSYVYYTCRERYGSLLANGIHIYEYLPSMMHGKVVLIDNDWVSAGSANLDPRSFFHNDELNLCTCHPTLLAPIEKFFKVGFQHSQRVESIVWQQRPLKDRLVGRFGNCFYWQL